MIQMKEEKGNVFALHQLATDFEQLLKVRKQKNILLDVMFCSKKQLKGMY
ncbi:hypothetical protein KFD70_27785 [Bacillus pfraonensis]|nr:hypothetical protein [Bacillus pseudomycoides]